MTENVVSSWDDYPVHQSADWIRHVATSDRNFYDRYYFNAFDTGGEFMAIMGLGQYPNLGVTDAFVTGIRNRWIRVRHSPIGMPANPTAAPFEVVPIITYRKKKAAITSLNRHDTVRICRG